MTRRPTEEEISLVDLRENPSQALLANFIELYFETFTDPREREDPAEWPGRMWQIAPEPQPWTHVLVALSTAENRVVGGLVFEHYRGSHCGLLTYLLVEPDWRNKGIARTLVDRAISTLVQEERGAGSELNAVFCETADPRRVPEEPTSMSPSERLHAVLSLGARILNVNYVQPRLVGGSGPSDHLLLLAFNPKGRPGSVGNGPSPESMTGRTVYDFLHEFYRALGIADPENDEAFRAMTKPLDGKPTLQDPRENPVLTLKEAAVCIHFVSSCPAPPEQAQPYPCCPIFQSMELDLMSYGYQVQKPFGSRCESSEPIPVEIVFPEYVEYHSEGRRMLLLARHRTRAIQVMISSTLFLASGISVWHLVLVPEKEETFDEYDIIKLIHLYDGRTENTKLADKVKFRVKSRGFSEREVSVSELLAALGISSERLQGSVPKAGTVQIIVGGDRSWGASTTLAEIMRAVQTARTTGGEQAYGKLARWISERTEQGNVLLALCGIHTGIFDFAEIDDEEALDTMEPTFSSPGSLIRINRCTMVNMAQEDRAMTEVKASVGISPYLLLPHAALLYNEALIEDSESVLTASTADQRIHLRKLENALRRTERNLHRFYLPNVFNYLTERTLFDRGAETRGTNDRLNAARAKLQEVDSQVKAVWERRHGRGQMIIAATLAVLTVVGLRDVFFDMMKDTALEPYSWIVLGGLAAFVVLLYLMWGVKRSA